MRRHMPTTLYAHPEEADLDQDEDDQWDMGSQQASRANSYYPATTRSLTSRVNPRKGSLPEASRSQTAYSHFVKRYRSQDDPRNDPDSHYFQRGLGQLMDAGDSDEEAHSSFTAVDISALALESESSHPESQEREQWRAMLASVLAGDVLKTEKTRIATVLESTTSERDQIHNDIWMGIRAKLHERSLEEERKKLEEQRMRTVDAVISDVHKFCLPKGTSHEEAMRQVNALLHRLDFVRSLYPHLKALYADRPVCKEPLFTSRRDALITWSTVLASVGHQIVRLQRWTGSETLDVNQRNTSAEQPIGAHAARHIVAGAADIADGSSFAERLLKEETMQRMFERRFLVTVHAFLVGARNSQLALASSFKEMNLPTFETQLVPLISFPTQLSQAGLRLRLEYVKNLQDPEVIIIDQMTEDLKISIGLACLMKRQYEAFLEPDPDGNWNLPRCISDDYDSTILDSMKVFFKLIHWKLKSGAKGIYFKETDVLEAQWDTFNDVSLTVSRGSCLIGEELCSTTNKLMVRVTNYFDTQVQVPTGYLHGVHDARRFHHQKNGTNGRTAFETSMEGGKEQMTNEQMVSWYGKVLDSYELNNIHMDLFIRTLVETGHFLVYTRSYEEESTYIVASHTLRDRPDAVTRILTEAFDVDELINEDGSRVVGNKAQMTGEEEEEPQYLLLLSPLSPFLWNGHTEERQDIPKIALDPKDNHVRLIADGPQQRLALAKEMFMDIFFLEDENGDPVEPEIAMKCHTEQLANIPSVNRELRKISRATTRLADSIINSVHYVRSALDVSDGCQELLENWYSFASEHGTHAQKFMERSSMVRFDRSLIKHAISWVSFICDDCDPTDRKTFKWAVNALEFTFSRIKRNIQHLPEEQFQMLRHKVAKCMTLCRRSWTKAKIYSTTRIRRARASSGTRCSRRRSPMSTTRRWGAIAHWFSSLPRPPTSPYDGSKSSSRSSPACPTCTPRSRTSLNVMELLHHPNIVEYYGIEVHRDKGGSLAALLEHGRIEDESIIQIYTMQMLDGLAYLHGEGIVHRDVKPDNILLDHRGVIKFVDFGAAKILAKNQRTMQRSRRGLDHNAGINVPGFPAKGPQNSLTGTPMYMSPEVIKNERRGRHGAMDIWSLGCVVLEFATGKKPWSNLDNEWAIMFHIGPDQLSSLGIAFIKECLTIDPMLRPSADDLKNHLWLSTLRATWSTYENAEVPADEDSSFDNSAEGQAASFEAHALAEIMNSSPQPPSTPPTPAESP
ncbi:hypothetical protein B0H12DRAFT_1087408 [Mycena haematopus]|nr:hypothetical protein B0H12DRAFT_1087408 [Mycena haematopus]